MATSEAQLRASKKYNDAHTDVITVRVSKDLAKKFYEKCEIEGVAKGTKLKQLIIEYVSE